MQLPRPDISVVMPVYNRTNSIGRAIESVQGQTFENFEILAVDDASTDGLPDYLASIDDRRLRVLMHDENKGAAAARNTGVAEATGEYVAFLDSDDAWRPEKLQRQLNFMRTSDTNVRASCTGYVILSRYAPEGELRSDHRMMGHRDLLGGCRVSPGSTLMVETTVFREIGDFNESLRRLEDWDWLLRLSRREPLGIMPDVLAEIDYRPETSADYSEVAAAVAILKSEHLLKRNLSNLDKRRFLGVLENELAATAYKKGQFRLAGAHLCKSVLYYPFRNWDSIKRIFRAVGTDAFGRR